MNPGAGSDLGHEHARDLHRLAAAGAERAGRRRVARPLGLALVRLGHRLAGADEDTVVLLRPVLRSVRG